MPILYHQNRDNIVFHVVNRLSKGSTSHVKEDMKELAKYVHKLPWLGVQLRDYNEGGIVVMNGTIS